MGAWETWISGKKNPVCAPPSSIDLKKMLNGLIRQLCYGTHPFKIWTQSLVPSVDEINSWRTNFTTDSCVGPKPRLGTKVTESFPHYLTVRVNLRHTYIGEEQNLREVPESTADVDDFRPG